MVTSASIIVNNLVDNVMAKIAQLIPAVTYLALLSMFTAATTAQEWTEHGGDKAGRRYSALTEITPDNVAELSEPAAVLSRIAAAPSKSCSLMAFSF